MAVAQSTQLKFNLEDRNSLTNMRTVFHNPKPIIIEKFDSSATLAPITPQQMQQPPTPMRFSVLSEDSMTEAVQLARRDLKKQREQQQQERVANKASHGAKVVTHRSREYRDRVQRRETRLGQMLPKENGPKKAKAKSVSIKESANQNRNNPQQKPAAERKPKVPVVGGENPYRRATEPSSAEEQLEKEIRRLVHEMEGHLEEVKQAVTTAQTDPPRPAPKYAEELDAERKRCLRAEQHNTRSSRSLYQLQQQVNGLQADIDAQTKSQCSLLSALAMSHRGTARTLQTLVHHLGDFDLPVVPRCYRELALLLHSLGACSSQCGVPVHSGIQQLLMDIQEMSTCEPEVHVRGKSAKSSESRRNNQDPRQGNKRDWQDLNSDHNLVDRSRGKVSRQEAQRQQQAQRHALKQHMAQQHHHHHQQPQRTPRQQALESGVRSLADAASPRRTTKVPPLRLPQSPRPGGRRAQGKLGGGRGRGGQQKGILMSADIQRSRKGNVPKTVSVGGVHYLTPTISSSLKVVDPDSLHSSRSSSRSRSRSRSPRSSQRRARSHTPTRHSDWDNSDLDLRRSRSLSPRNSQRSLSGRSLDGRTASGRSLSARSLNGRSPSGRSLSARSLSGRSPSPKRNAFDGAAERAVKKQVQLDRQAAREMREFERVRQKEQSRLRELKRSVDPEGHWVSEAEHRIRARLEPIIHRAQEISDKLTELCGMQERLPPHPKGRGVDREGHARVWDLDMEQGKGLDRAAEEERLPGYVNGLRRMTSSELERNADVLADSILTEVLEDTARHMQEYEDEEELEDHAMAMLDSPTLEQILQRMADMEKEENQIRRRWATIVYEDAHSKKARFIDAPYSDRPNEPQPLLLQPGKSESDAHIPESQTMLYDQGAIMFTKPKPDSVFTTQDLSLFPATKPKTIVPKVPELMPVDLYLSPQMVPELMPVDLYLSPQMVSNIKSHQAKYQKYLKNQSYQKKGKFDPWKIVQEVSDDVLSRCLRDVSEELLTINDDIVSHVYQAEFARVPEGTGMNVPPPPPGILPPPHSNVATQYSDTMLGVGVGQGQGFGLGVGQGGARAGGLSEGSAKPMFPMFGTNAYAMPEGSKGLDVKKGAQKSSSPVKETPGLFMKKSTVPSTVEPGTSKNPDVSPVKKSFPSLPSSPSPRSPSPRTPRSSLHRSSLHRSHDSTEPEYDEDFEDTATEASNT